MEVAVTFVKANGFDWDEANVYKVCKHGLSIEMIEEFFLRKVLIIPDSKHSSHEHRMLAFAKSINSRNVIAVFTMRKVNHLDLIRVISARYTHKKEVRFYEEIKKAIEG